MRIKRAKAFKCQKEALLTHQYISNVHLRLRLITVNLDGENVSIFMAKHLNDGLENKIGHCFYSLHGFALFFFFGLDTHSAIFLDALSSRHLSRLVAICSKYKVMDREFLSRCERTGIYH